MAKLKSGQLVWVVVDGQKHRGEIVAVGKITRAPWREAERAKAFELAARMPESVIEATVAGIEASLPPLIGRVDDGSTVDVNYYMPDLEGHEHIAGGCPEISMIDVPADDAPLVNGTCWTRGEKRNRTGTSWEEI